jgi:hypothetical protein
MDAEVLSSPLSPLGFGPFGERPLPANDQGSTLARSVSRDMDAIFAAAPPPAAAPPARPRVRTLARPQSPPSRSRIAGIGAVIAAALAGVVLGSILLKPHVAPRTPSAPALALAVPGATALPALPRSVEAAPAARPAAAKPQPVQASRPVTVRRAAASRGEVMAADRRLRAAYHRAARAHVPRATLVSIRNRWAAMRSRSPARVVAGYASLTRELEQATRRRGRR